MIPWWGWLVIWSSLVLVLLAVFAISAVSLFRKGIGVLTDFTELASTTIVFDGVQRETPQPRQFAVLMKQSVARDAADARALRRATIKTARRDARILRGKALVSAVYNPATRSVTTAKLLQQRPTARRR
jgi:hypothetical protein